MLLFSSFLLNKWLALLDAVFSCSDNYYPVSLSLLPVVASDYLVFCGDALRIYRVFETGSHREGINFKKAKSNRADFQENIHENVIAEKPLISFRIPLLLQVRGYHCFCIEYQFMFILRNSIYSMAGCILAMQPPYFNYHIIR